MLRSTATKRVLLTLERRLACLQITATRPFSRAAAEEETKPFPSNLSFDHRSSFAPQRKVLASIDNDRKEEEEEGDDNKPKNEEDQDDDAYYDSEDEEEDAELFFEPHQATQAIPLPDRLHVPVYNFGEPAEDNPEEPEEAGTIWLDASVFGIDAIRVDLLKRAVDYYRAKKRGRRKAKTKTIGELRGSGRKQRPQKGQGMARAGHKKVPHWRGGAKAHGPKNETDYGNTKLNKKVRKLAIKNVLAAKLKQGDLVLVNQFHNLPTYKTKELAKWLSPFGIAGRHGTTAFLVDHYYPEEKDDEENAQAVSYRGVPVNLRVAGSNLGKIKMGCQQLDLNVYDVLKHEKLVISLDALAAIEARYKD